MREQTQELPETPTADSETSESPEDDKQPECPDCPEDDKEPECPDCSEEKQKGENGDEPPHHTSPPRKNGRPTPVPFPLPHN